MSRSYRKPYWTQGYGGQARKVFKRLANKAVRLSTDIADGKAYKREFCSWSICDWKFHDRKSPKIRRK
jgi:hypothetical protein